MRRIEETGYRTYVTDSLRAIPQMSYLTTRWAEFAGHARRDERTADEIVDDVLERMGL